MRGFTPVALPAIVGVVFARHRRRELSLLAPLFGAFIVASELSAIAERRGFRRS